MIVSILLAVMLAAFASPLDCFSCWVFPLLRKKEGCQTGKAVRLHLSVPRSMGFQLLGSVACLGMFDPSRKFSQTIQGRPWPCWWETFTVSPCF